MSSSPLGGLGHLGRGNVVGGEELGDFVVEAERLLWVELPVEVVAAELEDFLNERGRRRGGGGEGGFPEVDSAEVVVGGEELEELELVGLGLGEAVGPVGAGVVA